MKDSVWACVSREIDSVFRGFSRVYGTCTHNSIKWKFALTSILIPLHQWLLLLVACCWHTIWIHGIRQFYLFPYISFRPQLVVPWKTNLYFMCFISMPFHRAGEKIAIPSFWHTKQNGKLLPKATDVSVRSNSIVLCPTHSGTKGWFRAAVTATSYPNA